MNCRPPSGPSDAPKRDLLAIFTWLHHAGNGGLHSTGPVQTGLSLKVPGGLEL